MIGSGVKKQMVPVVLLVECRCYEFGFKVRTPLPKSYAAFFFARAQSDRRFNRIAINVILSDEIR
jgi:hypothetical protein